MSLDCDCEGAECEELVGSGGVEWEWSVMPVARTGTGPGHSAVTNLNFEKLGSSCGGCDGCGHDRPGGDDDAVVLRDCESEEDDAAAARHGGGRGRARSSSDAWSTEPMFASAMPAGLFDLSMSAISDSEDGSGREDRGGECAGARAVRGGRGGGDGLRRTGSDDAERL